ncbi:MAG: ATPase [Leptolyngbya sp.]|nr:MAG: ATPase [Leptolyngbya sp.]
MDLLEYQAKELFRAMGIPVLPSQRIERPKDLKGLIIPYPVVLKSQVYSGERGRVGGVRFVENTIDAIAAAQTIFNLSIMGEYPKVLLAEAKYDADQEFYLAITLNRSVRRPVLLGSQKGGIDVEMAIDQMQHVVVEQEFSAYYARRLALKMGLEGKLIESVSSVVEKMYQLFVQNDLDLIEINPLGVSTTGEVMALDGKISVNDDAWARHPHLDALIAKLEGSSPQSSPMSIVPMESDGQIAIVCNGAGLTMATMDLVYQAGGKPISFLNIGSETRADFSPAQLKHHLKDGLDQLTQNKQVKVVLINLISNLVPCDEVAEIIASSVKRHVPKTNSLKRIRPDTLIAQATRSPAMVVRLVGSECERAQSRLASNQISLLDNLDEAVTQAVSLAKVGRG